MRLFYSYAHKDERRRERLEVALAPLKREGLLDGWHDRRIEAGADRQAEIDRHLEEAELVLLLLSPDFIASDYCYTKEAGRALERHAAGAAWVIPVLVRPVDWGQTPMARLQALPKDGRPVSLWRDQDKAWLDVALGVRRAVAGLGERRAGSGVQRAEVADDADGERVFLSSELFGFTKPWRVALGQPTGVALDRIVAGLGLPAKFDYEGRVGMAFEYQLVHQGQVLLRARELRAQGVRKEAVLELQVQVRPFAAAEPLEQSGGKVVYRGGKEPPEMKEAGQEGRALLEGMLAKAGW